ncbi:MAG: 5-formyltetrahydrofolate cyclo-ligase, partial [Firmicutes bacterium]|nr:5-formyltetrahydrofolate cyclo-ligase [Bacillota bacterium]
RQMAALTPKGDDAWEPGAYGIMEPVPEKSILTEPEDIDLVICPCTVFDEACNRMGMGGGYYDRYLPKCENAVVAAVAFEVQKAERVPMEPWDKAVDLVITEKRTYRKK